MHKKAFGLLVVLLFACGSNKVQGDLCDRIFEPYPDLISNREGTPKQRMYVNGMRLYAEGEYERATDSLQLYIRKRGYKQSAHLYLAMCHLVAGRPYEAELQLDHLENSKEQGFRDQTEWYTLVSWVCSEQYERALPEARRIAARPKHTYKAEAELLVKELESKL